SGPRMPKTPAGTDPHRDESPTGPARTRANGREPICRYPCRSASDPDQLETFVGEPITCLIVDDHEVVREGLRLALSRTENIRVVGEAADGSAAVALAKRRRPQPLDARPRGGGEGLHPEGGAAPDAGARDPEGGRRRRLRRPRADARVPHEGTRAHAHRPRARDP